MRINVLKTEDRRKGNNKMEYQVLKMRLDNVPWDECYDSEQLDVKVEDYFRNVEDRYADDINYGVYFEDDELAFYHAVGVYENICSLRLKEVSEENTLQIEYLQKSILKDFQNYLLSSALLGVQNKERILKLLKMTGNVCDAETYINFIKKYWFERKNDKEKYSFEYEDEYALNFPEVYVAFGDRALYEKNDLGCAIEFYQLALLEWDDNEQEEGVDKKRLQRQILYYKKVRDRKYARLQFESDTTGLQKCYKYYSEYFKICNLSLKKTDEMVMVANAFAEVFWSIQENTFYKKNNADYEYKVYDKDDFRLCYMMALQIYKHSFLWTVFLLMQNSSNMLGIYEEDVIHGVEFIELEYLQPVKEYWLHGLKSQKDNKFEILLMFLQTTAYVELIRDMLRERNPQNDIAYYTSLNTFRYMLPERMRDTEKEKQGRLSIMHVAYMNDPNEGKTLWNYCGGKTLAYIMNGQRRSAEYPYVFLKCFTPLIDDLPMWEMYGDHAEGCCIVFNKAFLRSSRLQVPLYKVCYLRKNNSSYEFFLEDNAGIEDGEELCQYLICMKEIYKPYLKKKYLRPYFRKITESIMFLFKDANYQHEREMRIMYRYARVSEDFQHTEGDYPKLYISPELYLHMKEIILGPKMKDIQAKVPYIQEELEKLCQYIGYKAPIISISEIEYQ